MKRSLVFLLLIICSSVLAEAADDPVTQAMKMYEKRHYGEASRLLRSQMPSVEKTKVGAAYLALGMAYLKNAELHRELQRTSALISADYLKKLSAVKGAAKSRFVDLYLGEALLQSGKADEAQTYLDQFIANSGIDPAYSTIARLSLGQTYFLRENKKQADEIWAGLNLSDPDSKSMLAAIASKNGMADRNPVVLADESLAQVKKSGKAVSQRFLRNMICVYGKAGLIEKGMALANDYDLKAYSYREVLSKSKIIHFYDLSFLGDLSELYLQAAIAALEKAAADHTLRETANYYLGEAHALGGNTARSSEVTASFLSSAQMPRQYKDKAAARQYENQYLSGHQVQAFKGWEELAQKQPEDPDVIAEIITACSDVNTDCASVVQKAASMVEKGEGRKFFTLNIALGKMYLSKKDYARAAAYMEAGRDKSNKNKIESNDPVMLIRLAEVYYRTKKYSEALEIYFEMSKQFPEVRQIQEALQGIYSMEQKSAGDVKIF